MHPRHCVVIGGQAFIGRSLVVRLLKLGNWIVRIVDSVPAPAIADQNSVVSTALNDGRASYLQLDVRDKSQVLRAVQGTSVVFYIECVDSSPCDYYQCYMHIVQGAKNVINACQDCKVERLIYNSSSDVVFDGFQAIHYADESLQYPWKYLDMLNDLRSQAESLILFANEANSLLTCALRPSNVFGPGDTYLVPSLIKQANSSLAKFILGNGDNLCDFTYVENVAHAHICAAEAQGVSVAGKAFFITNLEPMYYWEFVSRIYKGLGYPRPVIKFPAWILAYGLLLLKWLRDQLESEYSHQLVLTQFCIQSALFTRTFSCTAAEERLRYSPVVSLEEGLALTVKSFPHSSKDKFPTRYIHLTEESKAEKLLGSGKVADILLWRDEKETFTWFLGVALVFYWFFLGETTFITSAARLLLLVAVFLFAQNFLPLNILGFTIRRISWSYIHISDSGLRATIVAMVSFWNKGLGISRSLAKGEDWNMFLKVLIPLYLLKLVFSLSCCTVLGLGKHLNLLQKEHKQVVTNSHLSKPPFGCSSKTETEMEWKAVVFAFTSFFTYEQYEEEIDGFVRIVIILVRNLKTFLVSKLPESMSSYVVEDEELCEVHTPSSKESVKVS